MILLIFFISASSIYFGCRDKEYQQYHFRILHKIFFITASSIYFGRKESGETLFTPLFNIFLLISITSPTTALPVGISPAPLPISIFSPTASPVTSMAFKTPFTFDIGLSSLVIVG